jgi:hypothetical protein
MNAKDLVSAGGIQDTAECPLPCHKIPSNMLRLQDRRPQFHLQHKHLQEVIPSAIASFKKTAFWLIRGTEASETVNMGRSMSYLLRLATY